ncbi:MAG: glycosyltransferase, partial [Thermoflexales bacterium]
QLTHGIVVSSPIDLAFLRQREPAARPFLIPPGVDFSAFTPGPAHVSDEALRNLPRPIFFCASAFASFKRIHLLIDAVAELGQGSLVLAGDGPERNALLAMAEQRLGSRRFRHVGVLARTEMREMYRLADVYCLPSINEPFGIVMIEAMACNRPVVATDDRVRRWILGDAGLVVDVTDRDAFASALAKASRSDWDARPKARAEFFSLERVARSWNDVIAGLLAGRTAMTTPYERDLDSMPGRPNTPD